MGDPPTIEHVTDDAGYCSLCKNGGEHWIDIVHPGEPDPELASGPHGGLEFHRVCNACAKFLARLRTVKPGKEWRRRHGGRSFVVKAYVPTGQDADDDCQFGGHAIMPGARRIAVHPDRGTSVLCVACLDLIAGALVEVADDEMGFRP